VFYIDVIQQQIYTSLALGVTENDLIAADNVLGFKIPQTLRAMYR
jgi:hypothetical protein